MRARSNGRTRGYEKTRIPTGNKNRTDAEQKEKNNQETGKHSSREKMERPQMTNCELQMTNDFGTVDLTPELQNAYRLISQAAWTLQMTPAELCPILAEAPDTCPHCEAEKKERDDADRLDYYAINGITPKDK